VRRGTIVWLNLEDASPPEFGKRRPGIIISNSDQNVLLETVVAIPFSTQPPHIWPLRIKYGKIGSKVSFAVVPGLRQVKKRRLLDTIEVAPEEFLRELDAAVQAYLSD
jgi:mRNA interferase MazF